MANKSKMSDEGAELLKAVQQMKKGKKGRVYSEEQLWQFLPENLQT